MARSTNAVTSPVALTVTWKSWCSEKLAAGPWPISCRGVQERERLGICLLVSNASCLERRTSRLADAADALRLLVNLDMNAARCIEGELKD